MSDFDNSDKTVIELRYKLTCNPWSDRGPVILADRLEAEIGLVEEVVVEPGEITIRFHEEATQEQIAHLLGDIIRERQNSVIVPNSLARALYALNRDVQITDPSGNRTTDVTVTLSNNDVLELKRREIKSVKQGDNKVYRLAATYPGMPADLRGVLTKADELAVKVVGEATAEPAVRSGTCVLSDTVSPHLESLTQSLHIFTNKHHNASVRGFGGGNGYFKAGATWRYALALSATEIFHPFFESRNQGTTLLLPGVDDYHFLRRLHRHFRQTGALLDVSRPENPTSSTNIRNLYRPDRYSGIVSLIHSLRNPLTLVERSEDFLDDTEIHRLTRWVTGQFTRATYVSFGSFHTIDADPRIFKYVAPLTFRTRDGVITYQVVRDVFSRTRWPDTGIAGRFSRALVHSSGSDMKSVLFEMCKDRDGFAFYNQKGQPAVVRLFTDFINHFVEETYSNMDASPNTDLHKAAKDVGVLAGNAFDDDLTLLSRVYNIHTADELRDVLKTVLFRLEKLAVAQARTPSKESNKRLWLLSSNSFETLLTGVTEDTFREIADVLSIFASLTAFNSVVSNVKRVQPDAIESGIVSQNVVQVMEEE